MSDIENPTLRRRRLGAKLKRCREATGLTQQDVSRHFEWHSAKVTRIETVQAMVSPREVRDPLTLYNVRNQTMDEALVEPACQPYVRTWWTDYRDIMRPGDFVGLEAAASAMRTWEPVLIPGLFQTSDYMRQPSKAHRPADLAAPGWHTSDRPLEALTFTDGGTLPQTIEKRS